MIGSPGGDLEIEAHGAGGFDFVGDLLGVGQDESNFAQILLRRSIGCVVDLKDQFAIGGNSLGITHGHHLGARARDVSGQEGSGSS